MGTKSPQGFMNGAPSPTLYWCHLFVGGDLNTQRIHSFICPLDRYLLRPSVYKQCTRGYFAMVSKTALVSWAHRASVVVLQRGNRAQEGEGSDIQWQPITGQGLDMHASAHLFFSTTLPFCRWGKRKGTYPRSQARFKPRDCLTSKPLLSSLNSHWDYERLSFSFDPPWAPAISKGHDEPLPNMCFNYLTKARQK